MKLDKFTPVNRLLLLELVADAKETEGHILLPDSATLVAYQEGVVVRDPNNGYQPGDHLLFTRATGREIVFDGQDKAVEYVLVDALDIVGGYDIDRIQFVKEVDCDSGK